MKRGRPATCSYAGALRAHLRDEVLEALDSLAGDASPREQNSTSGRGTCERDTVGESTADVHSGAGSAGPGIGRAASMAAQSQTPMDDGESGGGSDVVWEPNSRVTQSRMMLSSHGEKGLSLHLCL